MRLTKLFKRFFKSEKAGGIILLIGTLLSLLIANSSHGGAFIDFWHQDLGGHSLTHWINDGLMTIFFLLIGLELEREIYDGELSSIKNASLPLFAAIGGMLLPVVFFMLFNFGKESQGGAGIPMATDIAFAIGILSLLGKRVPASLKVFLTALAVIDDIGAIIVIAIFYTKTMSLVNLGIALGIFVLLLALNRLKVRNLIPYLSLGVVMWYFMLNSGVHATIAGVLLAFAIPFGNGDEKSTSYILQDFLHKPVAFVILPIFAIANTAMLIPDNWSAGLLSDNSLGIITGLALGKPLGILLFSFIGVMVGACALPEKVKWSQIFSVGILAGIGFTMSIFITLLAYSNEDLITNSKMAILLTSGFMGLFGLIMLRITLKEIQPDDE